MMKTTLSDKSPDCTRTRIRVVLAVLASLVLLLAPTQAAIMVEVGTPGDLVDVTEQGETFFENGVEIWLAVEDLQGESWEIPAGASVSSDPDPFITTGFTFVSTSATTSDFIVIASNFSADAIATPIISGQTNWDLTDANNSGSATLDQESSATESLYNAFFGGDGDVRELIPPDITSGSLPVNASGVVIGEVDGAYSDDPAGAGLSIGEAFGIRHEFSLTPFDRITVQSTFIIEVPEPTSFALAAVVVVGLLAHRRFR